MTDVLVLGAGVIGASTAWVLRDRGCRVAVWHAHALDDTVSNVAGAIWYPFLAEPRERVLGWSARTFQRLVELADAPASGVRLQDVVEYFATTTPELWWASAAGPLTWLTRSELPVGCAAAIRHRVPVCATPTYMPWLHASLRARGVTFTRREVRSFDEAFAHADHVVNCTGLGARALCRDEAMQAVRGQVVVVRAVPGVTALIDDREAQPFYVIPRGDEIVLGGTAQAGDERLEIDPADTRAIVAGIAARVPALRDPVVLRERVGLRPYRSTVRLEVDAARQRLVHNHGHGGSGFTLAWGCAEEAADLLGVPNARDARAARDTTG